MIVLLAALTLSGRTICIDPGHPSEVGPGTKGKHITEMRAAWLVALKLKSLLEQDGYTVVMTKNSEKQFVTNIGRAEAANRAHAAYMVRLHCDAGSMSGLASYYPAVQGRAHGRTGPSEKVIRESSSLAHLFHPAVIAALQGNLADRGLHTDAATFIGGKQGGALTGSVFSEVPVVLVEMAVLQNEHDDLFISTEDGQEKVARALEAGVEAAVPK